MDTMAIIFFYVIFLMLMYGVISPIQEVKDDLKEIHKRIENLEKK